jgi:murein DD-endopeptidase MepM/ murein hydrolase activator NlpD
MPNEKGGHGGKGGKGDRSGRSKETGHKEGRAEGKASEHRTEKHTGAPASGKISSGYGARNDPKSGAKATHKGVDIAVKVNTPVKATGAETVTKSGWQDPKNHKVGYGTRVTINHGNGNTSTYGHLNSANVKVGDKVKEGQVIGRSGSTGKSTGPHLHYEERNKGMPHRPTYHPDKYKPKSRK